MGTDKNINSKAYWKKMDELIEKGIQMAGVRLIEEEKNKNGYLVVADKNGKIAKIPAKDF
ncbi:MAG: hypothetical protein WCF67_19615 [Chitinophagaceae bacterium]